MRCITVIAARGSQSGVRVRHCTSPKHVQTAAGSRGVVVAARCLSAVSLRRSLPGGRAGSPSGECQALVSSRAARGPCLDAESISAAASSRGNRTRTD